MQIGMLVPAGLAVAQPSHGVLAQARFQANALERGGHRVLRLNPWDAHSLNGLDVLHCFGGGFWLYQVDRGMSGSKTIFVLSPMIDSFESTWWYLQAARIGNLNSRLFTIPGVLRRQCLSAKLIVVRSSEERDRITRGLHVDPSKVRIVLNGVEVPLNKDANLARDRFELPDEFALHVSHFTAPRKNVARLIKAIGPLGIPLVIGGYSDAGNEMHNLLALANYYGNVRFVGFLDPEIRDSLYCACKLFCLPSIHEGTGLVALEAAARGANIVITKNGGPRDYFLDMAEYVDPFSVRDIRRGIEASWSRAPNLALQKHITSNLTWEQSAASLVRAYHEFQAC